MDTEKTVRQSTVSAETGIDSGQLARMIQSDRVQTVKTADGLALIPLDELQRLKRERRQRGRPKAVRERLP